MAVPARNLATYDDVARLPEGLHTEIIHGEIHTFPSGLPRHGRASVAVSHYVGGPFDLDPDGPGGWWIVTEVDVELSRHEVVRPDVSGWRRDRVPQLPEGLPIRIVPDWVCEILSPSNVRHDRITKADLYAVHGVPFYCMVDPASRVLEAFELQDGGWRRLGAWGDGDRVRIRPFDAVELDVGRLFPPPKPEEIPTPMSVSELEAAWGIAEAPVSR